MSDFIGKEIPDEMLGGEISVFTPCPTENHTIISDNIHNIFAAFFRNKPRITFGQKVCVFLSNENHPVPDAVIASNKNSVRRDGIHGVPALIAEILDPATIKLDREYKKNLYEAYGVPEYWIIDPRAKSIEVYLLEEGRYSLDECYLYYSQQELAGLSEEEREDIITEFSPSAFERLAVSLEDVFHQTK